MESRLTLEGRVALLTGSTRGIGWATARLFARHGATVLLNGRSDAALLEQRAAAIREEFGVPCQGYLGDAADPAAIKDIYGRIFREFKRLDVLVNNAGILRSGLLGMIPETLVREILAVNAAGPILHLQEAARLMGRRKSGSIINLTSILGVRGSEGQSVYAASKAAVVGLTLSAAKELAPKNIRVNAVSPGLIRTDMIASFSEKVIEQQVAGIKMGRMGEPEEVAQAILFLASDMAAYITGQVLGVDGGMVV